MGENVNPSSLRQVGLGLVEEPKYKIDKIFSYSVFRLICDCGFDNSKNAVEFCPICGTKLVMGGKQ